MSNRILQHRRFRYGDQRLKEGHDYEPMPDNERKRMVAKREQTRETLDSLPEKERDAVREEIKRERQRARQIAYRRRQRARLNRMLSTQEKSDDTN